MATNKKKLSDQDVKLLLGGTAIAVAYFGGVKPLTNWLGLTKDKGEKEAEKELEEAKTGDYANAFKSEYYHTIRTNAEAGKITLSAPLYSLYETISGEPGLMAEKIYSADGYLWNDYTLVGDVYSKLKTQAQAAQVAAAFNAKYSKEILPYMEKFMGPELLETYCLSYVKKYKPY
jgi:hypothetical protein